MGWSTNLHGLCGKLSNTIIATLARHNNTNALWLHEIITEDNDFGKSPADLGKVIISGNVKQLGHQNYHMSVSPYTANVFVTIDSSTKNITLSNANYIDNNNIDNPGGDGTLTNHYYKLKHDESAKITSHRKSCKW